MRPLRERRNVIRVTLLRLSSEAMVLALLFLVVPVVELYVIVKTSHAIGFLETLGLLVVVALVGSWLIKREGLRVWTRFNAQLSAGAVPSREIADGVCLLAAGALMLTPGFVTDLVALLLVIPPTRAVARSWLTKRTKLSTISMPPRSGGGGPSRRGSVTETTATDGFEPPQLGD